MFLTTCGNRLAQLAQLAQAVFAHLETAKDNSFAPYTLAKVMAYGPRSWLMRHTHARVLRPHHFRRWQSRAGLPTGRRETRASRSWVAT